MATKLKLFTFTVIFGLCSLPVVAFQGQSARILFALRKMDTSDDPRLTPELFDALVLPVILNNIGFGVTGSQDS